VYVTQPDDGRGRLFVVEQTGAIRIVDPKVGVLHAPFLDVGRIITAGGERGLLGLAFHPGYRTNGRFFIYYTDSSGRLTVAEYRRKDATHADPKQVRVLLRIVHPQGNHNGGMMAFGPDGMLYIGTGDGGGAGDPQRNGQNGGVLLGKLLRIDIDGKKPYAIPATNPFVHRSGFRHEIWAYGLRNPWRFSFDRDTGALYIGDVGQGAWEEIDVAAKGRGGQDYGWNIREGTHCYDPSSGCRSSGLTPPVFEYGHDQGCAVIGGYVDRLSSSALRGIYLFSDYCSGRLWGFSAAAALKGPVKATLLDDTKLQVTGFGQDLAGQVYLVDSGGALFRIVATAP